MPEKRTCPKCGAEFLTGALAGLCPKCVGATALSPGPGTKLRYFGDYELLEEIARGGMGVVFKARQLSLNRIVAVKMILSGQLASAADVQRFHTEAEAAANLQHPNIVAIHEIGEQDGQHYFSMDFIEGKNLGQIVKAGPLPARRAAGYLKTMAEAIHYAHQHGTLHRDLKPSNVLIDPFDQPRLTDFGLAKRLHDAPRSTLHAELTQAGQVLGTPNFMPPEQASAQRGVAGPPSDVYSLGAVLYFVLTGQPPFAGETIQETLARVVNAEPVSLRALRHELPRDLETICLKCLEKEPRRRYASARDLAEDLDRFLRDEPILARPVERVEKLWRACRREPAVTSLAGSLVLAVTLLGLVLVPAQCRARRIAPVPILSGCGLCGEIGGKLYVTTPCDGMAVDRNYLHVYQPRENVWRLLTASPVIHNMGAGGVIKERFYVVGGTDLNFRTHGRLDVYDPARGDWLTAAPMPTARSFAAGVVLEGQLWVLGGTTNRTKPDGIVGTVEHYDPATGRWTQALEMPTPRSGLSAAAASGTIFAAGGRDSRQLQIATVEAFTPQRRWVRKAPLPLAVSEAFVAAKDGLVYVCGGNTPTGEVATTQIYLAAEDRWKFGAPMPEPRERGSGAAWLDGKLYLIGGWTGPTQKRPQGGLPHNTVFIYDPRRDVWRR